MARLAAQQQPQRHPRRRDGARQDAHDHLDARVAGVRARHLGPAPGGGANVGDAQLGDGDQEVLPRLQDPDLLRHAEGAQAQAAGLVQDERLPRLHHVVQARHPGSGRLPPQKVEVPHPRRGAPHQELPLAALADAAQLQRQAAAAADGHTAAKQPDGAVVAAALSDAAHLRVAQGVQGLVLQPAHRDDRGRARRRPGRHRAAARHPAPLPAAAAQEGRREEPAGQGGARRAVPPLEAAARALRGLHGLERHPLDARLGLDARHHERAHAAAQGVQPPRPLRGAANPLAARDAAAAPHRGRVHCARAREAAARERRVLRPAQPQPRVVLRPRLLRRLPHLDAAREASLPARGVHAAPLRRARPRLGRRRLVAARRAAARQLHGAADGAGAVALPAARAGGARAAARVAAERAADARAHQRAALHAHAALRLRLAQVVRRAARGGAPGRARVRGGCAARGAELPLCGGRARPLLRPPLRVVPAGAGGVHHADRARVRAAPAHLDAARPLRRGGGEADGGAGGGGAAAAPRAAATGGGAAVALLPRQAAAAVGLRQAAGARAAAAPAAQRRPPLPHLHADDQDAQRARGVDLHDGLHLPPARRLDAD
mmetsp:Transcript_24567/g.80106  ORF Transcript_24567/g.80106 Transcript_24567/m.80106 type:complete len:605 (+) Transcript_24567:570-2384(+)